MLSWADSLFICIIFFKPIPLQPPNRPISTHSISKGQPIRVHMSGALTTPTLGPKVRRGGDPPSKSWVHPILGLGIGQCGAPEVNRLILDCSTLRPILDCSTNRPISNRHPCVSPHLLISSSSNADFTRVKIWRQQPYT